MRAYTLGCLAILSAAAVIHCSGSGDDCTTSGTCATSDGGGGDGDVTADAGPDVVVPPGCDLTKDLADSPACIDDGIGVFVDAQNGDDDANDGSEAHPFKTIAKGIAAAGGKPRVYVCEGTYPEDVSITLQNAVNIYGGLKCGDWSYSGGKPVVGAGLMALHVDGLTKPVVFEDLTFQAADGKKAGDSSLGALVNSSADVTFRRVKLVAGKGMAGADGVTGSNWTQIAQSDASIAGTSASGTSGGKAQACANLCVDKVVSSGGKGGDGTLTPGAGADGAPGLGGQSPTDGKGGASGCKDGDDGASAPAGTDGKGAAALGVLSATGWAPMAGTAAKNGGPGQGGGGGGGGSSLTKGGGGGGACGGCGGAGGMAGGGGGASIALAVVSSTVTLASSELSASDAGAGGAGSVGQGGQTGGFAGQGDSPGCGGGNGGTGGAGGAGGGGAGGVSAGVFYQGTMPTLDDATTNAITVAAVGAAKGTGGAAGVNDGVAGVAQPVLQAK